MHDNNETKHESTVPIHSFNTLPSEGFSISKETTKKSYKVVLEFLETVRNLKKLGKEIRTKVGKAITR